MKKIAIFVEGYTELIFVEKLIDEVAGKDNVFFEKKTIKGGAKSPLVINSIPSTKILSNEKFYVLIYNCVGESQVAQRIHENHKTLTQSGFTKIIGLRDVRPNFTLAQVPRLRATMNSIIDKRLIPVEIILAVLEIEAWLLAEYTHYEEIDPSITVDRVIKHLNFDPTVGDLSDRENPTEDITNVYALGEKVYFKGLQTIEALDYAEIYENLRLRIPSLETLIFNIDDFLKPEPEPLA